MSDDATGDRARWGYAPGELVVEDVDGRRYRFGEVPEGYRGDVRRRHPGEVVVTGHRLDKSQVRYRHPAEGSDHCGDCVSFSDGTCDLVEGAIAPEDWCRLFSAVPPGTDAG